MPAETIAPRETGAIPRSAPSGAGPASSSSPAADTPEALIYDFRRPRRVSKDKLRSLEAMYERFAKAFEGWVRGRVRGQVQLAVRSIEQISFAEFTLSLTTPCASFIADIEESGGQQAVIDFGHDFAYFLVDRFFGGSGEPTIVNRVLTPIERLAVRTAAERMLNLLSEVWDDYVDLRLALSGFESIPEILRAANPEDAVLVANIEVTAGNTQSVILICLPFAVLEKFFAGATERRVAVVGSPSEQESNRELTESSVRGTRVQVAARLPEFRLTMRELLSLKPGSILATGLPRTSHLDILVGTQRRFQAAPGRIGPTLAVRLLDSIAPAPDPDAMPITRT